jgi:hypothetical protein
VPKRHKANFTRFERPSTTALEEFFVYFFTVMLERSDEILLADQKVKGIIVL